MKIRIVKYPANPKPYVVEKTVRDNSVTTYFFWQFDSNWETEAAALVRAKALEDGLPRVIYESP